MKTNTCIITLSYKTWLSKLKFFNSFDTMIGAKKKIWRGGGGGGQRQKTKICVPDGGSNPSVFMVGCSTTEPKRTHGEIGRILGS